MSTAFFTVEAQTDTIHDPLSAIVVVGCDGENSFGSISYSVGQIATQTSVARAITIINITESFTEGVQQPYTDRDRQNERIIEPLDCEITVYPNPTMDVINLRSDGYSHKLTYSLYNSVGQLIQQRDFGSEEQLIDLTSQPTGEYILKVADSSQNRMNTYKIIKAK